MIDQADILQQLQRVWSLQNPTPSSSSASASSTTRAVTDGHPAAPDARADVQCIPQQPPTTYPWKDLHDDQRSAASLSSCLLCHASEPSPCPRLGTIPPARGQQQRAALLHAAARARTSVSATSKSSRQY